MKMVAHEQFSRDEAVKGSSDRSFGLVFAGFFSLVAVLHAWNESGQWLWSLGVAGLLLGIALLCPSILAPFNRLWMSLGHLLSLIMNPLIMAILFFLVILPIGLMMRLSGKDPMNRRIDPEVPTYWTIREISGPAPDTMKNQF